MQNDHGAQDQTERDKEGPHGQLSLPVRRLQMLGVFQVRDKRRPHFNQQRFQLIVCGARNQGLVERVDDLLVIRDFVIDVRLCRTRRL